MARTYIIAEAGVNHNGSFELACKLVDAAKAAGVDCVKFQTFKAKNLVSRNAAKADYQKETTGDGSQEDMLKKLELSYDEFIELKKYCDRVGISFLSTPFEDVNLAAMQSMRDAFGLEVGYSDHTKGIEVPIAAVAMGATIIEKHFTLDRNMEGPDHKASLEPDELEEMVSSIRHIEDALGSGNKQPSPSETKNIAVARKSIVAKCRITAGDILSEANITVKRPGTGICPMKWPEIIGTKAIRDFDEDEMIEI